MIWLRTPMAPFTVWRHGRLVCTLGSTIANRGYRTGEEILHFLCCSLSVRTAHGSISLPEAEIVRTTKTGSALSIGHRFSKQLQRLSTYTPLSLIHISEPTRR